jgi:GTP-binding protein HflX
VGITSGSRDRARSEASLEELGLLASSAGATVMATLLQERKRRDPATLIGRGKVEELKASCDEHGADLVIFDEELSPAQQRNVEEAVERKTVDRTQLILDIFAKRARTREGRMQVELAQLEYLLPRLAGKGILLSRLGGGIGTRGPGETKLETDRRRIRMRISGMKRDIEQVRRRRSTRRQARQRTEAPVVALVGYTNAGKSTLFNALTRSQAAASDKLFMTLDPLVRRLHLGQGQDVMLIDTVGFIQKLPHELVAAFRATLEEVLEADLLLHVMDASAEDVVERESAVHAVLREIGAHERPTLVVLNKSDRIDAARARSLHDGRPDAVLVSAKTGAGLPELQDALAARLQLGHREVELLFRADESKAIAGVYNAGRVVSHERVGDLVRIQAELPERLLDRYRENLK